jgi:methane/ammonia monooxygenase subunit A
VSTLISAGLLDRAEVARLSRWFDFLSLIPILFVMTGAFHLSMILTVGDWDFWLDWKDRQWWPLVTPLLAITFPAAVQYVLWTNFRLPPGATVTVVALTIGTAITRYFAYHLWTHYPINMVMPATLIPSALILDTVLLLSRSFFVTAMVGGMLFSGIFYLANWPLFAMFHAPIDHAGTLMSVADYFGFSYLRPGVPEYLRIIERGTLRTYGTYATPLSAFCAAVLAVPVYMLWSYLGKAFGNVRFLKTL